MLARDTHVNKKISLFCIRIHPFLKYITILFHIILPSYTVRIVQLKYASCAIYINYYSIFTYNIYRALSTTNYLYECEEGIAAKK